MWFMARRSKKKDDIVTKVAKAGQVATDVDEKAICKGAVAFAEAVADILTASSSRQNRREPRSRRGYAFRFLASHHFRFASPMRFRAAALMRRRPGFAARMVEGGRPRRLGAEFDSRAEIAASMRARSAFKSKRIPARSMNAPWGGSLPDPACSSSTIHASCVPWRAFHCERGSPWDNGSMRT